MKKYLALFLLSSVKAYSAITLNNLTQDDVNNISKEFASNFTHTIVAPASSYGKIFGFEAGLVGGATKTPNIQKTAKKFDASSNVSVIPSGGVVAGVSIPLGITGELNLVPKITTSDVTFQNASVALKWTCTALIPDAPFDLAIRVHGGSSKLSYYSVINNINTQTSWKNKTTGYNVELSKKLLFIEPYVGMGQVSATTDIGVNSSTNQSIFTFTTANKFSASNSGSHIYGGLNLNLFILKIGAEYSRIMGATKAMAKLSLYF